jgi:hypothetical protein
MNFLSQNQRVQDLKRRGEKIILALETDWIPKEHRVYIQQLIQELGKLEGYGAIEVVRSSAGDLAGALSQKISEEEKRGIAREKVLSNVVVLAGEETIENNKFLKEIKGKAFMAGVDASKLEGETFVRLIEMITMAVRSALDQDLIYRHSNIEIKYPDEGDKRTVIFIPRAEKVKAETLQSIYDIQKKILAAS